MRQFRPLATIAALSLLMLSCSASPAASPKTATGGAATQPPASTQPMAKTTVALATAAATPGPTRAASPTQPPATAQPAPTALAKAAATAAPAASPSRPFKIGSPATWSDGLDGKVDSGASSFTLPQVSGAQPASKVSSWASEGSGQAATLATMDSYIGYGGSRLKADQGTVLFRYKPSDNLAESYATRHASWTDYGQHKPPQSGFMVDTIGWRGAPKGSFSLYLDPAAAGGLNFGIWDGGKWHYVTWKTPQGWKWDSGRWYEIGLTWGPKGQAVLVDGEMKASIPDVVAVNSSLPWFLGQAPGYWPYGPHTLVGSYDDVRVFGEQPTW